MKKLRITVDGKSYDVQVESLDEAEQASAVLRSPITLTSAPVVSSPSAAAVAAPAAGPGDVVSPLAGRVISIDCKIGDKVAVGDQLVTIEAMKMNTYVNALATGTVSAIHIEAGDGVDEGQALLTVQ